MQQLVPAVALGFSSFHLSPILFLISRNSKCPVVSASRLLIAAALLHSALALAALSASRCPWGFSSLSRLAHWDYAVAVSSRSLAPRVNECSRFFQFSAGSSSPTIVHLILLYLSVFSVRFASQTRLSTLTLFPLRSAWPAVSRTSSELVPNEKTALDRGHVSRWFPKRTALAGELGNLVFILEVVEGTKAGSGFSSRVQELRLGDALRLGVIKRCSFLSCAWNCIPQISLASFTYFPPVYSCYCMMYSMYWLSDI